MKLSASICTYNREKYLPIIFESIKRQTMSTDLFEVILVNNNSPGNTKGLCEKFKLDNPTIHFLYFEEFEQGLSFARNRSIKESNGSYITFLDDDAFLAPDYFEIIVDEFEKNKEIAALGGQILLHYETIKPAWENKYLNSLLGFYSPSDSPFIYESNYAKKDYPRGSNMSFRKAVFERIGNFNVELGRIGGNLLGGEEKDLFYRIYGESDYIVKYLPSAIVYHCVPIERTTKAFIVRQALGTGRSEQIRAKNDKTYLNALLRELVKWMGSIVLCFQYIFKNQWQKGKMILLFRYWVSRGLLFEKLDKII
ncbi:MAG: glycosyltransferase [Crocinitomicaceae bacterium]